MITTQMKINSLKIKQIFVCSTSKPSALFYVYRVVVIVRQLKFSIFFYYFHNRKLKLEDTSAECIHTNIGNSSEVENYTCCKSFKKKRRIITTKRN